VAIDEDLSFVVSIEVSRPFDSEGSVVISGGFNFLGAKWFGFAGDFVFLRVNSFVSMIITELDIHTNTRSNLHCGFVGVSISGVNLQSEGSAFDWGSSEGWG